MGVAEGYYFTRAVGVPPPRQPRSPGQCNLGQYGGLPSPLAPTPRRSRQAAASPDRPARLCKRDGSSPSRRRRDELSLKVSFTRLPGQKKSIYSYQLRRKRATARSVMCVCSAQWKYQRKSSSSRSRTRRQCPRPIGAPENEEAVIPSSGRARGTGSASNRSARFHSIPLWWRRRGPLNEYAESAFGSDRHSQHSSRVMK